MDRADTLQRLGVACVTLTVLLMVLGAWVKATGSGLSCPDWPACYGEWLPPFPSLENGGTYEGEPVPYTQGQILSEWGHRAIVSVLLLPLAAFAFVAGRGRELRPALRWLPPAAFALYFLQAGLGAVTVVTGNPPWATTAHLAMAVTFLSTLVVATTAAFLAPLAPSRSEPEEPARPSGLTEARPFTGYTWNEPKDP